MSDTNERIPAQPTAKELLVAKFRKHPVMALALVAVASWFGYQNYGAVQHAVPLLPAAAGSSSTSDTVHESFVVGSAKALSNGKVLINTNANFRDPSNRVFVATSSQVPDANALAGKNVTISGSPSSYQGKPQVTVHEIKVN